MAPHEEPHPTLPVVPDFTPVPRKYSRHDGWTATRQRAFIDALAATGSVKAAAHSINMSYEGAYHLRRQPGAESFRAAWNAALDHGVQNLADAMMERALNGVPAPIMYQGEQVAERRVYNERASMFILRHHLPEKYGELKPLAPRHQTSRYDRARTGGGGRRSLSPRGLRFARYGRPLLRLKPRTLM
jgi:hypothetical protein